MSSRNEREVLLDKRGKCGYKGEQASLQVLCRGVKYMDVDNVIILLEWLRGQKYLINEHSDTMTEDFEREYRWELSRNIMIDNVIKKIFELI